MPAKRITLFKVPGEKEIQECLDAYDVLRENAKKDGKQYILSLDAGRVYNTDEARSQGYTVAVESTFASREDIEYYDTHCEAHKVLKKITGARHQGVCTLLFDSDRS